MTRPVNGLTESQFQTENSTSFAIDSSSHKIEALSLNHNGDPVSFLKKTYASPDYSRKSGSQRAASLFTSVVNKLSPFFTSAEIEDPDEEKKQLELSGQLEAFYSALYRVLLCEGAAETYALFDDDGNCVGTASKVIEGFTSAKKKKLVIGDHKDDLAKMLVASYVYQEDDLHKGNYGVDARGRICRLDFDMSGWELTANIKGQRAVSYGSILTQAPKNAFELSKKDIINLPELHTAQPFYWPTSLFYYIDDATDFRNLKDDLAFNRQKYLSLLQFCLIPDDYIRLLGRENIEDKYRFDRDQHVLKMIERKKDLLDILVRLPAFYCTIYNDGDFRKEGFSAWEHIRNAFEEYNSYIRTSLNYNDARLINIDAIELHFQAICRRAKLNEPTEDAKRFQYKSYEPFIVPEHDKLGYAAHKADVRQLLSTRLENLRREKAQSESSAGLIYGVRETANALYERFRQRQNINQLKIDWLEEVLENAQDEEKVIMEWFQTKRTPFYPIIKTGRTGKLIEVINDQENEYARRIIEQHAHGANASGMSDKFQLSTLAFSDDSMNQGYEDSNAASERAYFAKLKAILREKISLLEKDYRSQSYWDMHGARRKLKFSYWTRVGKAVDASEDYNELFSSFSFTQAESSKRLEILEGTETSNLIRLAETMRQTLPDVPTERNHAIHWTKYLLRKRNIPRANKGYSSRLWGSTPSDPSAKLERTLKLLMNEDNAPIPHPVRDCFNVLAQPGPHTALNDIKDLIEIFQSRIRPQVNASASASSPFKFTFNA